MGCNAAGCTSGTLRDSSSPTFPDQRQPAIPNDGMQCFDAIMENASKPDMGKAFVSFATSAESETRISDASIRFLNSMRRTASTEVGWHRANRQDIRTGDGLTSSSMTCTPSAHRVISATRQKSAVNGNPFHSCQRTADILKRAKSMAHRSLKRNSNPILILPLRLPLPPSVAVNVP